MKDAIGGTWLFQLAMVFIVLFAGYLALSVNYSKAFRVKNEILTIIEKNEGITSGSDGAQAQIITYLNSSNHIVYGVCKESDGNAYEAEGTKGLYCIKKTCIEDTNFKKAYYKVTVFFKFDLPFLGDLFTFKVQGETQSISFPQDDVECDI